MYVVRCSYSVQPLGMIVLLKPVECTVQQGLNYIKYNNLFEFRNNLKIWKQCSKRHRCSLVLVKMKFYEPFTKCI